MIVRMLSSVRRHAFPALYLRLDVVTACLVYSDSAGVQARCISSLACARA